ncbi:MAG TPA: pitrilysin family protein [Gemmatimonadaceae bacterium]|nr:pitrilysin family protein [Gemmatimonadaceae bacterium]
MVVALRPKPGPARNYQFPKFDSEVLAGGLRLLVAPVEKLPLVTVLVVVDTGSTNEPAGKEGVAKLTARVLPEGSRNYDGAELAEKFEQLGTSLESGADWDSTFIKITVLSERLPEALALLGEVLTTPVFPEREVERLKAERLSEILQTETEPRALADERFESFLYAEESRYSKPDGGSADSVTALKRADVEQFYRSCFVSGAITVILAGDIDRDRARTLVEPAFSGLVNGSPPARALIAAPRSCARNVHVVSKGEAPQSELRVGHIGLPRTHPDFFPTMVMNAVLGGLFGSRINLNLREAHGYTYGASSYYDWRRGPGPFAVATAVASDVTALALREIFLEIDRIRHEEISAEELSLATSYLEGVFPIRYETTSAVATALANLVVHALPRDYYDSYRANIRAVTAEAVLEAARKHLHPDELQTVVVGDPTLIREPLARLNAGSVHIHNGQ